MTGPLRRSAPASVPTAAPRAPSRPYIQLPAADLADLDAIPAP
jgi:hypothetical protein